MKYMEVKCASKVGLVARSFGVKIWVPSRTDRPSDTVRKNRELC